MASILGSNNQKLQKTLTIDRRPLMLKDYLADNLSFCSSSGFKSFPRQQCCTTVRFLLELDLKSRKPNKNNQVEVLAKRCRSRAAALTATTVSVLHRASEAVIKAVKLLPFPTIRSSTPPSPSVQNKRKKGVLLLPQSLSRKRWKRSFRRKSDNEGHEKVQMLKFSREFLEEQENQWENKSNHFNSTSSSSTTATTATTVTSSRNSTSTRSDSNNNSWTEGEFTANSEKSDISSQNDPVAGKKDLPAKEVSNVVGVTVGEDSIKEWPNEEKEQFSPVSVLDCPFEDDQDIISSPFHCSLARMEGRKQKLMQKIRRFESLAELEPVDLAKRIALSEMDDLESLKSPASPSTNSKEEEEEKENGGENETESRRDELLRQLKSTIPSNTLLASNKADNLLLNFFTEKTEENKTCCKYELLKEAEDWVNGHQELFLVWGWEVKDGRKLYLKDMEKNGGWRNLEEEKQEVGLELEQEIFSTLVIELFSTLEAST
ncbi:hypothetical protein HS088_TW15G00333 [Tripterygium wilfordii]|uniref:Uncharacterized protein n=1 Tax=Tripterygium wilfordii TaxID=458696 RepID=A0A7J7CLB5_TRIWF|nr:uncharacterized protein LOC120016314 [Tripterygium wilfordii]KAF5734838.1 hypothetical protein HS088_TW15G00333 [Tripterygium wilfordii]